MKDMSEFEPTPNFIAPADGSIVDREAAIDIATHIYLGISGISLITKIQALHRFIRILSGNGYEHLGHYERDVINKTLNTGIFAVENWKQDTTDRCIIAVVVLANMIHIDQNPESGTLYFELREPFSEPGFLQNMHDTVKSTQTTALPADPNMSIFSSTTL